MFVCSLCPFPTGKEVKQNISLLDQQTLKSNQHITLILQLIFAFRQCSYIRLSKALILWAPKLAFILEPWVGVTYLIEYRRSYNTSLLEHKTIHTSAFEFISHTRGVSAHGIPSLSKIRIYTRPNKLCGGVSKRWVRCCEGGGEQRDCALGINLSPAKLDRFACPQEIPDLSVIREACH